MADVLGYLHSKGMATKSADARNVHTACVFCNEDPAARGRLYVNVDEAAEIPGLYFCHLCGAKGSLVSLKRFFGDPTSDTEATTGNRAEILEAAANYYHRRLGEFPEVVDYLKGPQRGLHVETITAHRIGYAPMDFRHDVAAGTTTVARPSLLYRALRDAEFATGDILATGLCHDKGGKIVDALGGMVTIPYTVAGNVVAIRGRTWPHTDDDFADWGGERYPPPQAKYKTCGGTSTRLFNTDACWNTDEVYVTEGEFDALTLSQQGFPAIGVPGAKAWQEAWDDYLKPLRRVWVIFDRDAAGEAGATALTDRHGSKVRRVHLSEEGEKVDPTEFFAAGHTRDDFEQLVAQARRGGLLVTVAEAIDEFHEIQGQKGLKFGWELLDIMISPGLQRSQIMVLLAKTGTGKTLLLLNLMQMIRMVPGQENVKVLFLSLEQTRGEWWDRARRIHRFYNIDSDDTAAARYWQDNLLLVDRNRVTEDELRQVLDDFTYEMGEPPDLLAIDYLGYWARSFKGEAYARMSDAAMAIKAIAKDYRIPIIVPQQVSRLGRDGEEFAGDAARDSGVIEETADFLLTMWNPDNLLGRGEEEKTGQVHLRIAKSRHGGRGQLLSMQTAPISLVMVPEGNPLCARARNEIPWNRFYHDQWEVAVFRHRTGIEGKIDTDENGRMI